jgi:tRNA (cytidine56-2'-O)-methyltransferase
MSLTILRLNHRPIRDRRISTHLFLAARTFGANDAIYTGIRDQNLERSIDNITKRWGGSFHIEYSDNWRRTINSWKGKLIHLTMYGIPIQEIIHEVRENPTPKLIIVGGSKVPAEIYKQADWNIAITNQPHSEVSALAIFLHELYQGTELHQKFHNGDLEIEPQARGKKMKEKSR